MPPKPTILLADDHQLLLDGLDGLLAKHYEIVGTVLDGHAAVAEYDRLRPDILLLDITMPLLNGIEVARQVRAKHPAAKILFVSMQTDESYLREAFVIGASGYVLKRSAAGELIQAIEAVLKGCYFLSPSFDTHDKKFDPMQNPVGLFGSSLTPRQREVLQLVAEGKTVKEISAILKISGRTVEFHKSGIQEALGLRTTADLTRYAITHQVSA